MPNSFPVLTFVSILLRIIGWVIAIIGLFYFVLYLGVLVPSRYDHADYNQYLSRHGNVDYQAIYTGFGVIVIGLIAIIIGECVGVLFAIEANTRQTVAKLSAISIVPRAATPVLATARAQIPPDKEAIAKASIQGDPDDK